MRKNLLFLLALILASSSAFSTEFKIGLAVWSGYPDSVRGFKEGLASEGLVEGQNVEFIQGQTGADQALQKTVAEGFKQEGVDLVYSLTTPGTSIIKEILPENMPIVFSIVTYPADSGLIESFEYSGNNLVGTSNYVPLRHYLRLLTTIMPSVQRVAIFHRRGEPNSKIQASSMLRLLKRHGIEGIDIESDSVKHVIDQAKALIGKVDLFMTTTDTLMQAGGEEALITISLNHGVPILSSNKSGIEQGATFGSVADFYILGKMAGVKAAKILTKGVAPSTIESELQDPPLFLVNKKSADRLGIVLSDKAKRMIQWTDK